MQTRLLRALCSATLAAFAALSLCAAPAQAQDDFIQCGTPYPGWWRHIHATSDLTSILSVDKFTLSSPIAGSGSTSYTLTMTIRNASLSQVIAEGTPFSIAHGTVGYWNPDQPYDPNNPINPYAMSLFETATLGKLPALKPGATINLTGKVNVPFGKAPNVVGLSVGYDDDGICPPYPFPFPGPNPWWKQINGANWLKSSLSIQALKVSDAGPSPWKGYAKATVVIGIQNVGKSAIPAGSTLRVVHSALGNYVDPTKYNPNDPFAPFAEGFRETLSKAALPALKSGESYSLSVSLNYPTTYGYPNLLQFDIP